MAPGPESLDEFLGNTHHRGMRGVQKADKPHDAAEVTLERNWRQGKVESQARLDAPGRLSQAVVVLASRQLC